MGTQHGNRHQLSVTLGRVTYIILRAHTGTGVRHSKHRRNPGEGLEKNAGEWTEGVEICKEESPGSRRRMHGYIQTCSRLERENL